MSGFWSRHKQEYVPAYPLLYTTLIVKNIEVLIEIRVLLNSEQQLELELLYSFCLSSVLIYSVTRKCFT